MDGVVRWRRIDLKRVIEARFGVIYSERGISRLLGELGFAHISARPQHPRQDKRIIEAFKKTSPTRVHPDSGPAGGNAGGDLVPGRRMACRLWAERAAPRQPADQRYRNACLFGAICPATARGRRLLPWADGKPCRCISTRSAATARKAHAVVLMEDGTPPANSSRTLPSRAPELNPVENIWQYLRANWLSNRVFEDYNAIVDAGCEAWNKLVAQPETITSIECENGPISQC